MSAQWHYCRGEKQSGPVTEEELKRLASHGGLSPDDLVWRAGMGQWVAARKIRGLFTNVSANPAPAAAPADALAAQELPEVLPVEPVALSPLGHTTIVRHSFIRALFIAPLSLLFGLGFLALAIYSLPSCFGWFSLIVSIVFVLGGGLEGMRLFQRGPILIIDRRGFTDTRAENGGPIFLPWNEIVGAGSFRVRLNLATASDTLTIQCRRGPTGKVAEVKIDTQGLTMSGAGVADVIKKHLRAFGR